MKKIYVCCPGDSVTGGPELLHQLVGELRSLGKDASIVYYPFDKNFSIPKQYEKYNVNVASKSSCDDGIVVLPEERTSFLDVFKGFDVYIWWLSVDSYFGKSSKHNGRSYFKYIKRLIKGRSKPLSALNKCRHMAQSEYARLFLEKNSLNSEFLSDYLNQAHFKDSSYQFDRKDQILYNPKKGYKITDKLIKKFPEMKFIPLHNMSSEEVAAILRESKIYIDFGSHPGKDRFPREAAMAGCCVITGRRGSAKNCQDIFIPESYKLNENSFFFLRNFELIIDETLNNYKKSFNDFQAYRGKIEKERFLFEAQVKTIFE